MSVALIINRNRHDINDSYADTSYSFSETRLFEVSAFFKEHVGISASDHFNANATLYIMKQSPPLSIKYHLYNSTTMLDNNKSFSWHYYLHRNSNVTLRACVDSNCYPYHIYIVKGTQNFVYREKPHANEKDVFIMEICSASMSSELQPAVQVVNYTVEKDDHYYFVYYSNGYYCYGGDNYAGFLSL